MHLEPAVELRWERSRGSHLDCLSDAQHKVSGSLRTVVHMGFFNVGISTSFQRPALLRVTYWTCCSRSATCSARGPRNGLLFYGYLEKERCWLEWEERNRKVWVA